jgi:SAM-dependent methyltransferase
VAATEQFDEQYFERLEAAGTHWWVQGMQDIGWALLDESRTGLRVLDAGCGTGVNFGFLVKLAAPNRLRAIDAAPAALGYCGSLGAPVDLLEASVTDLPFDAHRFDLVVSIDVIQHLDTRAEAAALSEFNRVLCDGGRLLVRTNSSFGRAGVQQRADWRLYTPATLTSALTSAGLAVEALTSANALQGLWASLPRRRRRHHEGVEEHRPTLQEGRPEPRVAGLGIPAAAPALKNAVLRSLLHLEARWVSGGRRRLPFGHSLLAVARRP